jgi:autotransporter translocation and assembly factor TamB
MKRINRTLLLISIVFLISLVLISLLLRFIILIPPIQNFTRSLVENAVSSQLTGKVSIGAVRTDIFSRIVLKDIIVRDSLPYGDATSFGRIRISYSLLNILKKQIDIKRIVIDGALISAVKTRDGVLHLPLRQRPQRVKKGAAASPWKIIINTVIIRRGEMAYRDSLLAIDAALRGIKGRVRISGTDMISLEVITDRGHAITPWWNGTISGIDISVERKITQLIIKKAIIRGDSLDVNAVGTASIDSAGPNNLSVHARLYRNSLAVLNQMKFIQSGGALTAAIRLRGAIKKPEISAGIAAIGITVKDLSVDTLSVDAQYDTLGKLKAIGSIVSPFISGLITTSCLTSGIPFKPDITQYTLRSRFDRIKATEIINKLFINNHLIAAPSVPDARASMELFAQGRKLTHLPDSLWLTASIKEASGSPQNTGIDISSTFGHDEWNAHLIDNASNSFQTQGIINKGDSLYGSFALSIVNPSALSRYFLKDSIAGTMTGSGSFSGKFIKPSIKAKIIGKRLFFSGITAESIYGKISYEDAKLHIDSARVLASGPLGIPLQRFGIRNVSGLMNLSVAAAGYVPNLNLRTDLIVQNFQAGGFHAPLAHATGSLHDDTLTIDELKFSADSAALSGRMKARVFGPGYSAQATFTAARRGYPDATLNVLGSLHGKSLFGKASASSISPALLSPWMNASVPVQGDLLFLLDISGTLGNPRASLSFSLRQLPNQSQSINYQGSFGLRDSTVQGMIRTFANGVEQPLLVMARLPLTYKKPLLKKTPLKKNAVIAVRGENVNIANLLPVFMPTIKAKGPISLDGRAIFHGDGWTFSGEARTRLSELHAPPYGFAANTLEAEARFGGPGTRPVALVSLRAAVATLKGLRIDSLKSNLRFSTDTLFLDTLDAMLGRGVFTAAGAVPILAFDVSKQTAGRLHFSASNLPLASLPPIGSGIMPRAGTVSSNGSLVVSKGKPTLFCRISLVRAMMQVFDCGPIAGPITADIVVSGDSVSIASLAGKWGGGGLFQAAGFADLKKPSAPRAHFGFSAKNLLVQCTDIDIGLQSISLTLIESRDTSLLTGNVNFAETRYLAYFSLGELVRFFERPRRPPTGQGAFTASLFDNVALRVAVNLKRNLLIETNIGNFTLDGRVTITGTTRKPGAVGTIAIVDGYVYYLDRKFLISQGSIRLENPEAITPVIDFTATTRAAAIETDSRGAQIGQKEYQVSLRVTGNLGKPSVALTAQPPLRDIQIVSLLTFGTVQGNPGADFSQRLKSFLKQQIAGFGTRKLEKWLNLESIQVQLGNRAAVVTAVKRLTPRLTITYSTSTEAVTKPQVQASYRLLPFLYIDGTGDYAARGGIDVRLRLSR